MKLPSWIMYPRSPSGWRMWGRFDALKKRMDGKPDGYAVVYDDGSFSFCARSYHVALGVCEKQKKAKVRAFWFKPDDPQGESEKVTE